MAPGFQDDEYYEEEEYYDEEDYEDPPPPKRGRRRKGQRPRGRGRRRPPLRTRKIIVEKEAERVPYLVPLMMVPEDQVRPLMHFFPLDFFLQQTVSWRANEMTPDFWAYFIASDFTADSDVSERLQ